MDRQAILKAVETGYAARIRGDLDGVLALFAPNANFQINATPVQPAIAHFAQDADALRGAMKQLIGTFTFSDMEIIDSVVEGSKAVVRSRFTIQAKPTGKTCSTEVLDIFEFKDGKVVSMIQFCDTAEAARLLTPD